MPAAPPASEHKKPAAANDSAKKPADSAGKKAGPATDKDAAKGTDKGAAKGGEGSKAAAGDKAATGADKAAGGGQKEAAAVASGQRFDRMAVRAKLAVSEPGDAVEREADQIAERISRKPDVQGGTGRAAATPNGAGTAKNATKVPATTSTPSVGQPIARAAAPQATESPDGPVTKDNSSGRAEEGHAVHDADTQKRIKQQIGQGEQMAEDVRVRMEREFGHDFSRVRIHQDASANELCSSLGVLAFTTGSDIFFATGRYQPGSQTGVALLAHELAHVVQQQDSTPAIARKIDPDMPTKYKEKNAAASAAAMADLGKLEIPAVKARHLPLYSSRLNGNLKRKRGYDRGSPNQIDKWNKGIQIDEAKIRSRLQAKGLTNVPADAGESFKLVLGNKKKPQSKSITQLQKLLKIPTWSRNGKALGFGFQVDHIIELQVSGENGEGTGNSLENMELLDQPSNSSSGGAIRSRIYTKVDAYLKTFKPAPKRRTFLKAHDIVFESVQANLQSGASAAGSSWWTLKEIQDAVPLDQVTPAPPVDEEGTATEFLLLSGPGGVVTQRIAHPAGAGTFTITGTATGSISGLTIDSVTINDKAATGAGNVGSVSGAWNLPKKWTPADPKVTLTLSGDGKHRGYPSKVDKTKLEFAELSPVDLDDISIDEGKVSAEGALTPSLPFLNAPINVTLAGEDVRFSMDYSPGQLALSAPGVSVDDAMVSVFYSTTKGFGVSGGLDFSVDKVGGGELRASFSEGKGVAVEGQFDFDSDLFDVAKVNAWWRQKEGGFGASGELKITKPGKIKGLKSANLNAVYKDGVFTAKGDAETDIPGIKGFKAEIVFVDEENFSVTGSGDFEKLPGIESGSLTMTVAREGKDWSLSGKGNAIPKLPGGAKANIAASYDKGIILVKGNVHVTYGTNLLEGDVGATVTNAASVDAAGNASGEGGKSFKVFGHGSISATLGKIKGKVDLDLLQSGEVKIGGTLTAPDQKLFDEYPPRDKNAGEPKLNPILSVPIPGLGFGVGGINVGVVLGAKWGFNAYASIGPGYVKNIHVTIAKFNPENFKPSDIKIEDAGANLEIPATAGVSLTAAIELTLEAPAVRGGARLSATAAAEIPKEPPAITGKTKLKWSYDEGLDIQNEIKVKPTAELKFSLKGTGFAELNLYVKTITLWSRTWPLGEVAYQLPLKFEVGTQFGWNSNTGFRTQPADLFKPPKIDMGSDDFGRIVDGRPSTQVIKNVDADTGEVLPEEELVCREPMFVPQPVCEPDSSNASVNPKREDTADASTAPGAVDENIVSQLGTGMPLDLPTRGYFEQRLKADLTQIRIYTGPDAARETERLSAKAFTVGHHIAFAKNEYQPITPEGQELIAHELAHVAQKQSGGGEPIILRWPAVTRTDARTSETPASIRAMTLSEFALLTESQLDWATSPDLQADAAALTAFRDIDRFTERPNVADGAGDLNVGDVIAKGIPAIFAPLEKYAEGAATRNTAWLRSTNDINKAESWGRDLTTLEAAWPAANLSLVMRAPPDPAATAAPFEKLVDPARPELANFISYLTTCAPVLSANDGSEVDSFITLRGEGVLPHAYHGRINYAKTYHHFTKNTLDGLVSNEAFPQWEQEWSWLQRPLTVVLYPAIDDNHAFHRNAGLEAMVTNDDILTIVIEGHATVGDYQSQLAPVAARYGINGEIYQAMVGGHGNSTVLNLAGSANAAVTADELGTSGTGGANTTGLMTELTRLMSTSPAQRRIVLDACLTDSHHVASALRASPADAAADVNAAIAANPSLRDVVAGIAGAGSTVLGADASFAPSATTFMTPGSIDIGLSVPGDPDLVASKLTYVEFGTEPAGCMRAVLECWAADQIAGTHDCRDAVLRRIGAGRSTHVPATDTWRECIIHPVYDLAVNHYWGSGDAIRQLGDLADHVFLLYMVNHTTPAQVFNSLPVISGNLAHVNQFFTSVTADPTSTSSMRVAITLEQAWMQYNHARRGQFMTELARYGSCALAAPDIDMNLVMPHVPDLLALPPPAAQLKLALLAARHAPVASPPPSPLPSHIAFLRGLLGAGPTFPAAAGIGAALGPLGSEEDILAAIGRPLTGAPDPARPPNANINLGRADVPDQNEFAVTPLRRNGVVATARDDLMVRSRPTTSTNANIFAHLPTGTPVLVIGEFGNWYVIEQPGRTGFVAKRYITLVP